MFGKDQEKEAKKQAEEAKKQAEEAKKQAEESFKEGEQERLEEIAIMEKKITILQNPENIFNYKKTQILTIFSKLQINS